MCAPIVIDFIDTISSSNVTQCKMVIDSTLYDACTTSRNLDIEQRILTTETERR